MNIVEKVTMIIKEYISLFFVLCYHKSYDKYYVSQREESLQLAPILAEWLCLEIQSQAEDRNSESSRR